MDRVSLWVTVTWIQIIIFTEKQFKDIRQYMCFDSARKCWQILTSVFVFMMSKYLISILTSKRTKFSLNVYSQLFFDIYVWVLFLIEDWKLLFSKNRHLNFLCSNFFVICKVIHGKINLLELVLFKVFIFPRITFNWNFIEKEKIHVLIETFFLNYKC